MNTEANNGIIGGGFKIDSAGKLRLNGKMVDKATAEAVQSGSIITGFSMEDLKRSKQKKAASAGKSILEQLNEISPSIGLLKVGMTAKVPMPKGDIIRKGKGGTEKKLDPKRSFVMSIVTKLNSITAKTGEWEGRKFDSASDDAGEFMYITRMEDAAEAHVRKTTAGRKKGTTNGSKDSSLSAALEASRKHLDGDKGETVKPDDKDVKDAEVIMQGGEAETGTDAPKIEDATVIKH
jgi:hypothetical protein